MSRPKSNISNNKKHLHLKVFDIKKHSVYTIISLGTEYCGRRFANAEELLVHVKTHTNLSTSDPRALSILNASSATPNSHQRYHPYSRPPGPPTPSIPPLTPPMPPALAALASNPYASLYTSLFSRPPLL